MSVKLGLRNISFVSWFVYGNVDEGWIWRRMCFSTALCTLTSVWEISGIFAGSSCFCWDENWATDWCLWHSLFKECKHVRFNWPGSHQLFFKNVPLPWQELLLAFSLLDGSGASLGPFTLWSLFSYPLLLWVCRQVSLCFILVFSFSSGTCSWLSHLFLVQVVLFWVPLTHEHLTAFSFSWRER